MVWAVDEFHLANYLLPRECPRVCWAVRDAPSNVLLASPADRVIAIEQAWLPALEGVCLRVHELDAAGFTVLDAAAGYWVNEQRACVLAVREVTDCQTAIAEHGAELRIATSLWPYVDAVVAVGGDFSCIRLRNAIPRDDAAARPVTAAE